MFALIKLPKKKYALSRNILLSYQQHLWPLLSEAEKLAHAFTQQFHSELRVTNSPPHGFWGCPPTGVLQVSKLRVEKELEGLDWYVYNGGPTFTRALSPNRNRALPRRPNFSSQSRFTEFTHANTFKFGISVTKSFFLINIQKFLFKIFKRIFRRIIFDRISIYI